MHIELRAYYKKGTIFLIVLAIGIFAIFLNFERNKNNKELVAKEVVSAEFIDLDFAITPRRLNIDDDNIIWISAISPLGQHQLIKYNPSNGMKKIYYIQGEPNSGFYSDLESGDKDIWVGFGNSIIRFDKNTENYTTYELPSVNYSIISDKIPKDPLNPKSQPDYMLIDMALKGNEIWITRKFANSITKFLIDSNKFEEFKLPEKFGVPENIYFDNLNNIWLTVNMSGEDYGADKPFVSNDKIGKYNITTMELKEYKYPIQHLAIDSEGNIWYNDLINKSIVKLDPDERVTTKELFFESTPFDKIIVGNNNNFFITSKSKIIEFDKYTKDVRKEYKVPVAYGRPTGIPPGVDPSDIETVPVLHRYKDILFDSNDNMWFLIENYKKVGFAKTR